jgi:hypothetical protein
MGKKQGGGRLSFWFFDFTGGKGRDPNHPSSKLEPISRVDPETDAPTSHKTKGSKKNIGFAPSKAEELNPPEKIKIKGPHPVANLPG